MRHSNKTNRSYSEHWAEKQAERALLIAERERRIHSAAAEAMDQREDLIARVGAEAASEQIQAGVDELFN